MEIETTNNKKKILYVVTQSELGGAQHYLFNLVTHLDHQKYNILVAAGPQGDDKNGLLFALEKEGIKTKHLQHLIREINPWQDFLAYREIKNLIKEFKPDVVQSHSSKAGLLASLAAKKFKIQNSKLKILYRIGGWSFNEPLPYIIRKFYFWAEKFSARHKDIIIVNSEHNRKQAVDLKICPREKIVTIYNGIDLDKLNFLSKEEAKEKLIHDIRHKTQEDKIHISDVMCQMSNIKIIGTIANLYKNKGIEYLINAAHLIFSNPRLAIIDLIFIIIGEGKERKNLELKIKNYELQDKFLLIGDIPNAAQYLKAFDVFVLPSIKEGMPWGILEAMAAELPIIATKVGGIPEVLRDEKDGILVPSRNYEALTEMILRILENQQLAQCLAESAKKRIRDFSLKKMVRETEKLY